MNMRPIRKEPFTFHLLNKYGDLMASGTLIEKPLIICWRGVSYVWLRYAHHKHAEIFMAQEADIQLITLNDKQVKIEGK